MTSGAAADYDRFLERIAPMMTCIGTMRLARTTAMLIKRQVMGREVVVAITNGRLDFGPWNKFFTVNSTAGVASACW